MLRFGTIGTGWITDEYIRGAKDSGLWQLAAVYSRDLARARAYAQKHGAEYAYDSVEALAQSDLVDAVYVASPNALHYEHCKALLRAGKHVICEKPLCAQAAKVEELNRLAAERGLVFLEAIMFLHQPQLRALERALDQIGPISLAKLDFCQRSSKLDRYLAGELPNIFNPRLETGALMDLGVYCVYPALYLFGEPESAQISAHMLESGADGCGVATLRYPDKLVTLTYSKLGQAGADSEFQGPEGTVAVQSISRLGGITLRRKDGTVEEIHGQDEKYQLMGWEAKDFYRCITDPAGSRREYARCVELSLQTARLMEALRRQAGVRFASDGAPQ